MQKVAYTATTTTPASVKRYHLTVHEFKQAYTKEKEMTNKEETVLKSRKRGPPELVPGDIMAKTLQTVKTLHLKGGPACSTVINAIAKGVVTAEDQCLLTEYGGHLAFGDHWARNTLNDIMRTEKKMIGRIANTSKVPVAPDVLNKEKFIFQRRIQELVTWHEIPREKWPLS